MNGYDLLKIVLNWAGAPLTAEDIKKHRCVRQSANSITVSSELLRDHRPEWDKLSNDVKDGFWFIKVPQEGHITMRRFDSNEGICQHWAETKKDHRNLYLMALIVDGEPQFVGEYIQ